jgi:hypothetical protein
MNLMLTAIFAWLILGLTARHLTPRHYAAVVGIAVLISGLYYFMRRFM